MSYPTTVALVSKCVDVVKTLSEPLAAFTFKGTLYGHTCTDIALYYQPEMEITKGEKYLIYAQIDDVYDGHILGKVLKIKPLKLTGVST